ncbi:branched-chain amino acid ABC transporter permease [Halorussus gelatinilyticus]|uniref:Branched-chain amino acid ABC transporter permease n=1 Tax=Halorussus gelatinilyticus TaxID=2937524 RepID=A0A8U0IJM2_9EURY|nr:branched-chain amino acid ABC transporter permease [Halorussus gelatinilyticus]UPW00454.1 branched-chain amino acid ABC transporter permease [Halorussus gelatinilyticus]
MALSSSLVSLGIIVGIYAILALGLNIKFGYTGLLDIGHVAFYLVGAYVTALLVLPPASTQQFATYILGWNWPWLPAIAVGTLAAGLLGMLVALPAIRLREDYLAIAVLGISVILKRVVQSEGWLANGPGSLRGFSQPFRDHFPLPADTLAAAALLGFVVLVLWTVATFLLAQVGTERETEVSADGGGASEAKATDGGVAAGRTISGTPGVGGWVVDGLLALTTLGVGYVAARRSRTETSESEQKLLLGGGALFGLAAGVVAWQAFEWWTLFGVNLDWLFGLVVFAAITTGFYGANRRYAPMAGAITAAAAFGAAFVAGDSPMVAFVFLAAISLFTWIFGAVAVVRKYSDLSGRDFGVSFALAIVFVACFAPLIVLGGGSGDAMSSIGLFVTMGMLVAFLYGVYYVGSNWSRFGSGVEFVRIVGVGAIWLFAIRYFVMASIVPFQRNGVGAVVDNTIQNLLWLLKFQSGTAEFDYARFLLVLTLASLGMLYYLAEITVESPFGRVLKAIHEDEDVATSLGKNTFAYKVQSMMLGSALAGFAGGLTAIYFQSLVHTMFAPRVTFIAFLALIIGGTANNKGMILGATIYWAFQKATADIAGFFPTAARSSVQALRLAFIGALLIIILYYRPEGLWGEKRTVAEVAEE